MMRSMFSGVSGLRAHQTRMDVIGNNVANVNTVGFKSGRVTFQEVFNQTLKGAGAPDSATGRGGTNPMQVGLGIGIGVVDTIVSRGSLQRTDNPTDLSVEGEGFFIVKGGENDTFRFTRAGNFGIDKLGNLVSGNGMNVMGWQKYTSKTDGSYEFDTEGQIGAINLYSDDENGNKRMIGARATTDAIFAGNLNAAYDAIATGVPAAGQDQLITPVTIYDALGTEYKVNIRYWKRSASGTGSGRTTTWMWKIEPGTGLSIATGGVASGMIQFDEFGQVTSAYSLTPDISFRPNTSGAGASNFTVKFDFDNLTMYSADSSVKPTNVNGYPAGTLVTFNIGGDGIITGIYSNGQQQPLGLIALASFENPGGLQKVGDNMFIPTTNSGDFKKGLKAGSEGVGMLNPGTLEMSNVDLSKEFTDMIVTQRGFQANSRIITTSDEMLQELVNLKR